MIEDLHERDSQGFNKENNNNNKQRELSKEELFNFWYQAFSLVADKRIEKTSEDIAD